MVEPGLDKHEWESWWQQFEEDVEASPAEALSELDRLTVEILEARGYALDDRSPARATTGTSLPSTSQRTRPPKRWSRART